MNDMHDTFLAYLCGFQLLMLSCHDKYELAAWFDGFAKRCGVGQ